MRHGILWNEGKKGLMGHIKRMGLLTISAPLQVVVVVG